MRVRARGKRLNDKHCVEECCKKKGDGVKFASAKKGKEKKKKEKEIGAVAEQRPIDLAWQLNGKASSYKRVLDGLIAETGVGQCGII